MASTLPVSELRLVPVSELREWERNPRRISDTRFEALKRSMQADPDMLSARPVIALPDGRVFAGNMRLRAAVELGWESIPTVYADLDETRAATWALRDNNPYGEWDDEPLAVIVSELERAGVDPLLTGFSQDDFDALIASLEDTTPVDRGEELSLADVSIGDPSHACERGDRWRVGPHLLIVEPVYDGWARWTKELSGDDLFVPYPTPTLPLTKRANTTRLVLVQPDPWLAGHLLDKYAAVKGDEEVAKL